MIGYRDPATGAQVWQVTGEPAISHPSYFLQSSFFPGGRSMFFTSYRSGSPQVWTASLDTGDPRQITSGPPVHPFSPALHPGGDDLIVTRGGGLWTIRLSDGSERCVFDGGGAELGE